MVKKRMRMYSLTFILATFFVLVSANSRAQNNATRTLSGTVFDEDGISLPGVGVFIKGTNFNTITDVDGKYQLKISKKQLTVTYTYVGMKAQNITIPAGSRNVKKNVTLKSDTHIDEVIVTGIVSKSKESFTGSVSVVTQEDLKKIGVDNPLKSLSVLDPSFNVLENNSFGSDPNHLPDINIRNKSSIIGTLDESTNDPNQPLFIVDGFESSLEAVYNMDINRIASMTILKDAASTAIYGSKAANGVVVVETVKPKSGDLRLSYNGSLSITTPDLSSYNLMNSTEKLQFEKMAGRYSTNQSSWSPDKEVLLDNVYNQRLSDINSGVDTYWLSVPLRTGLTQKHNVYAEGGEAGFLFGLGANYSGVTGVMKDSDRETMGGNIDITYRLDKLQFQNKLTITNSSSSNPTVSFNEYASANPYYKKTDSNGSVTRWLENTDFAQVGNPLYNASLNSRNKAKSLRITNYFVVEYMPVQQLKFRAKAGLSHETDDDEIFISPSDTRYENVDIKKKGSFSSSNQKSTQFDGELTAIYADVINNHRFNVAVDGKMSEYKSLYQGYYAVGFPEGNYTYPSFSNGYPEGGGPSYSESISRSVNFLTTINYSYDNKYLLDFNYNISGSSVFGTNKKFIDTWSVGLGWNIMNETFFKNIIDNVSMLKLRASIGNPGNQNFNSAKALTTYKFLYNNYNYFGNSTLLEQLGNPDLRWQTTLDQNYGFDLTMLDNRLNVVFDYYKKRTDPLLITLNMAPSTGVPSWYTNLGVQKAQGYSASLGYYIIHDMKNRKLWSVRATVRHDETKLDRLNGVLDELNDLAKSKDTKRYYDGADPDAIWAVRSAGIDPATGKEMFIKKDGTYTFDFDYDDEVIVGNTRSKIEGYISSNYTYKGFTLGASFGYKLGGKAFNYDIYNKVENISGSALNYNQDKRAFYDRWQNPGDIAKYKNIANSTNTPISSRFVQKNNSLSLSSVQVGYDFYEVAHKLGFEGLRLSGYVNDVFWLSTIKQERGTYYPYARSFSLSLSFTL